ncbi:hypothetical protein [Weissella minor]|uniref:hypothetical protein n=1 Tax=Weissella minor TaxID=1620 RepID=UPI003AF2E9E2
MRNNAAVSYFGLDSEIDSFDKIKNDILTTRKVEYAIADKNLLAKLEIDIEDERLRMESYWEDDYTMLSQTINAIEEGSIEVEMLVANAVVPRKSQTVWNATRTDLLPHEKNVHEEKIQVVFFKTKNTFSYTVRTKDKVLLQRINENLIGNDLYQQKTIDDLRLFSWIYWKYSDSKKLDSSFEVPFMTAFVGNIGDTNDDSKITGKSEDISQMGAIDLHIATDEKIKTVGLKLLEKNNSDDLYEIQFKFDNELTLVIDASKTTLPDGITHIDVNDEHDYIEDRNKHYIGKIVFVYAYVIPKLETLFASDEANFEDHYMEFRNQRAIEVYKKLIRSGIKKETFKDVEG